MWLILSCGVDIDGCGGNDIAIVRTSGWNAEAAIVGIPDPNNRNNPNWRHPRLPTDGSAEGVRFQTQRECLTALRRANAVEDHATTYANSGSGWETTKVEHHRDFVEKFEAGGWDEGSANMAHTYDYACFHETLRVG